MDDDTTTTTTTMVRLVSRREALLIGGDGDGEERRRWRRRERRTLLKKVEVEAADYEDETKAVVRRLFEAWKRALDATIEVPDREPAINAPPPRHGEKERGSISVCETERERKSEGERMRKREREDRGRRSRRKDRETRGGDIRRVREDCFEKGGEVALSASESSERVREEDGISRNMPQRKSADSTYPT